VIVKVAPNRRDRRDSFAELNRYLTEGLEARGGDPKQWGWEDLTRYMVKSTVEAGAGMIAEKTIAVEAGNVHSLATAAIEMTATAAKNNRVDAPVVHLILSWPAHEKPDPELIFSAARRVLKSIALDEHQYVIAIHDDTEHRHAHIATSRVHPRTLRAQHLPWLHRSLHRAAREIEIEHGWSHCPGLFTVVEVDGIKTVVPSTAANVQAALGSERARAMETWTGEISLERWCQGEPAAALRNALVRPDASWNGVHQALATFGLALREAPGGGLRVHDISGGINEESERNGVVKASKAFRFMTRSHTELRFGPFTEATKDVIAAPSERSYKRDPAKRLERRLERAVLREELRREFDAELGAARASRIALKAEFKIQFANERKERLDAQKADLKARLKQLANDKTLSAGHKEGIRHVCIASHAAQRSQLLKMIRQEQAVERAAMPELPAWRTWVESRAMTGDQAAISALRGMVYLDRRKGKQLGEDPEDIELTIRPAEGVDVLDQEPKAEAHPNLEWRVTRRGTVMYFVRGEEPAFEDAGSKVAFCRASISDEELRAALRYAMGRWGSEVRLSGGDSIFRDRAERMLVEIGGKPIGVQESSPASHPTEPTSRGKDSRAVRKGIGR
jgi:hypothetical protein